jgi:heavy metal translocating P-type ATPase
MLLESSDGADSQSFREKELFKKCQEIGIIPKSEEELAERARTGNLETLSPTADTAPLDQRQHLKTESESTLSLNLRVDLMWCPACAWVIEETLKRRPGIVHSSCSFSTDRVRCEYSPIQTSPQQIIDTINSLGYKAYVPGEQEGVKENRTELIRFLVTAFLTMNVMMLSYALYSGFFTELSRETIHKLSWPTFLMASVVIFYGGKAIYQRAWAGISSAAFGMETLITVGSFSAYLYSVHNLLAGSIHLYFDTASMLITLVLLGKLLERRARDEVQEDLANFFSLRPTKVRICSARYPGGRYVAAEQLRKGDSFRVEEYEILPADGVITEGKGVVDESSLTGEPYPVPKKPGDRLKSGTKVVRGMLTVKAEEVGEHSVLGQMILIMERALDRKTPLEGKTDRALQWFVPVILILALGTGAVCLLLGLTLDKALIRAVTVLVISCPCTLGIAIPMARVAGISVSGKKGILVRDFSSFEQAGQVDTFVLDKTGTVTKGNWSLLEVNSVGSLSRVEILGLASSLEKEADHPIGFEIIRRAQEEQAQPVSVTDIRVYENGVSGFYNDQEVKIGSGAFLNTELKPGAGSPLSNNTPRQSLVFMSLGGRPCATFVFGDELRSSSTKAVQLLRGSGHRVALISGDGEQTTKAVAEEVGIQEAYGSRLPQEKALFVASLQQDGRQVAMVGDGINDAPALVQADLAIAVHSGSHLGKEAADLTLMRGDPLQVWDFLQLADKVKAKIHQNLGFSFMYNLVSIPIAMSGLLSPLIAVSAMLLSSLSVIGNTLLLLKRA